MSKRAIGSVTFLLGMTIVLSPHRGDAQEQDTRSSDTEIRSELKAAQARLEAAARQVADLTMQLSGDAPNRTFIMRGVPNRAMLGVGIAAAGDGKGVKVVSVSPGGPAEAAGLRLDDVLITLDGERLAANGADPQARLLEMLGRHEPGDSIVVGYLREGGEQAVTVTTRALDHMIAAPAMPGVPFALPVRSMHATEFDALELVELTPALGRYFGTDSGLLIVRAPPRSELGLEDGDVIRTLGGRAPRDPGHAYAILASYAAGEKVKIEILRDRKPRSIEIVIPERDRSSRLDPNVHFRIAPPRAAAAPLIGVYEPGQDSI
jgi:S1-C subfamily serine protease